MPLPPLATLEALSDRLMLSEPASADGIRALAAIEDASALIRAEAGKTWVDDDGFLETDIPDIIEQICLQVAYRSFRNPDGTTQASVGDVSVSYSRDGRGGAIFLTEAERRLVRGAAGVSRLTSVQLVTPYFGYANLQWAPTEGDDIPLGPWPWE